MVHLRLLELTAWRNYEHVSVAFTPGAQLLVGANGQGKTNLVEAVAYLATGASHRVAGDQALVRSGADEAIVRADVAVESTRTRRVELALRPGGRSRARVDGRDCPRLGDAFGHVQAVLFAPEDIMLVRGDPTDRRRFLDDLLAQRRPAYRAARIDYERVLRQRNSLLKQLRAGHGDAQAVLPTWTDELARTGARLVAARLMACAALAGPTAARYAELADTPAHTPGVQLTLERSSGHDAPIEPGVEPEVATIADELRAALAERAAEERERGMSLVGPHRDDLRIELGGLPAKTHASQGEAWSLALALRLAGRELLREVGHEPVVLLDDVFAELDVDRRRRLAAWCGECEQVLITAAVADDVPVSARRLTVTGGAITSVDEPDGSR